MTSQAPAPPLPRKSVPWLAVSLVVAAGIVFFLTALVAPKFVSFPCRAKQSEAKGLLKTLHVLRFEAEKARPGAPLVLDDGALDALRKRTGAKRYAVATLVGGAWLPIDPGVGVWAAHPLQGVLAQHEGLLAGKDLVGLAVGNLDNDDAVDLWGLTPTGDLLSLASDCSK